MPLAPLELMVLSFPAKELNHGIEVTLDRLTSAGDMRIVDVLVIRTDAAGGACGVELSEVTGLRGDLAALTYRTTGLINEADIDEVTSIVDLDTDTLAVLLEHRWVHELASKVAGSSGTIVSLKHIPGLPASAGSYR